MEWGQIVETWGAVAAVLAALWALMRPYLPVLCRVATTWISHIEDAQRRDTLLMLVRSAEEIFVGPGRGQKKRSYVIATGRREFGYDYLTDEVNAAARELTKEQAALNGKVGARSTDPP